MLSTPQPRSSIIRESKIVHKSPVLHPLARFVTEQTAALLFKLKPEQIYRIDCWRYVVYVHGKGVSKFVSYADFPPIVGVEAPTSQDFIRWRKRWKNKSNSKQAPEFWQQFYAYQFREAVSTGHLRQWGELVNSVKASLTETALQWLRELYQEERYVLENF